MTSTTRTIDQLRLSPFNVRTNQIDAGATDALEKSILARGMLLPLIVHPMKGHRQGADRWGVHAGGRRYRAIKALIDRKALPADFAIDVIVRDGTDAELLEDSTVENLLRRDLRPYELFAAVARAHRKGDSPETIAATLGQEIVWVRQAIRLGNLVEPIFRALEAESITVDQARAYAATEDRALQLAAFEAIGLFPEYERTPVRIRGWLKVGDAQLARLLRFVGAEAYRTAGGGFELDLFAEVAEERGRIMDADLLRRLADAALEDKRNQLRAIANRPDLRFQPEPPLTEFRTTDYQLQITPTEFHNGAIALPDGNVVGCLTVREGGDVDVTWWWASRKAKFGRAAAAAPAPRRTIAAGSALGSHSSESEAKRAADAVIREEAGASADTVQIFRSLRRVGLRGILLDDARAGGTVAQDYLIWSQLRHAFADGRAASLGVRGLQGETMTGVGDGLEKARPHVAAAAGTHVWGQAIMELTHQTFLTGQDLDDAFLDYRASGSRLKSLAAAIVAGIALERSLNADGYRVALHDTIAAEAGATPERLRELLPPTPELIGELPKSEQLKIAEPFVEAAGFGPWSRLKTGEIAALVLEALNGTSPIARPAMREAARTWVHPLLRFGTPAEADVEDAEQLEAVA